MGFIRAANGIFWGWTIIVLLIVTGLLFTVGMRFPQIRHFKDMFRSLFKDGRKKKEGVNSFAALCSAVGGQVGTGNMAGVATAIASGGPGLDVADRDPRHGDLLCGGGACPDFP